VTAAAPRSTAAEPVVIVATIVLGLALDQAWPHYGQWLVNAGTLAVFAWLLWQRLPAERIALLVCLGLATAGEIFLSLVWQLYHYRDGGIPLFVPPGHVLLFVLGTHLVARIRPAIHWPVGLGAATLAAYLAWRGIDQFSALMTVLFVACLFNRQGRQLYSVMFMLALAMELYGTWLGNWRWEHSVPYWGLSTLNPPFAAGVFYCLLDFLVVSFTERHKRREAGLA
jgi:hypothetical protein